MKTKDQLAQDRYGLDYKDCCWAQKSRIDGMYAAEEEKEKKNEQRKN